MSNAVVEFLREQAPKDTEHLSDRQLSQWMGEKMRSAGITKLEEVYPDFGKEYQQIRLDDSSLIDEAGSALASAIFDRLPQVGYALGAATTGEVAEALGFKGPKEYALRGVKRNQEQAAERTGERAIGRWEDVTGPRSFARYAVQPSSKMPLSWA